MRSEGPELSSHAAESLSKLHEMRISCIPEGANGKHIPNVEFNLPDGRWNENTKNVSVILWRVLILEAK